MATKRLGKGLEALIRSNSTQTSETTKLSSVSSILISKIKTNPLQPRKEFKKDSLKDLASSIKENGVISPITVREDGGNYTLIAGERRLRASRFIKLKEIPAYVMEVKNNSDMMQLALIENIQRENLNPMEESEAYAILQDKFNFSQNAIAKSVGKSHWPLQARRTGRTASSGADGPGRPVIRGVGPCCWLAGCDSQTYTNSDQNTHGKCISPTKLLMFRDPASRARRVRARAHFGPRGGAVGVCATVLSEEERWQQRRVYVVSPS